MKILEKHIHRYVYLSTLVVLLFVICVDFLFFLIDEMGGVTETYSYLNVLQYVLKIMPRDIHDLLPFSAMSGALIGLGILATQNELVIFQASGISKYSMAFSATKSTILFTLAGLLLGEFIAPQLEANARNTKTLLLGGREITAMGSGKWIRLGRDYVHINIISSDGRNLTGVTRYRIGENGNMQASSFSQSAEYIEDAEDGLWLLTESRVTEFLDTSILSTQIEELEWDVNVSPELLSALLIDPDLQSISGLYRIATFLQDENLDSSRHYLAFWKKLLQPLTTASLVLLAVSFVFGPLSDSTMGSRTLISVLIGLIFAAVQGILEPTILLAGITPILSALIPVFLFFIAGIILLWRTN